MTRQDLNKVRVVGLVKALQPILHGAPPAQGEKKSNHLENRKMKFVVAGGEKIVDVPVVSGNSIRGLTRQRFIMETMKKLDVVGKLAPDIAYFLIAGGASDAGWKLVSGPDFRNELRKKLPFIDLLGGSLYGCFIPGLLRVDFMVPLTKETFEAADSYIQNDFGIQGSDLLSVGEFTYATNNNIIRLSRTDSDGVRDESGKALYSGNPIPQGALLSHGFLLEWAPKETELAFWAYVDVFMEYSHVGGWLAKGLGKIETIYREVLDDGSTRPVIRESNERVAAYWESLDNNKEEIADYLITKLPAYLKENKVRTKEEKNGKETNDAADE